MSVMGCSGTRLLDAQDPQPSYDQINRFAEKHDARVTLRTGREVEAHALRVRPDSTTWIRMDTETSETISTSDLREVEFTRPWPTSILGAVLGVGVGVGLSAAADDSSVRRTVLLGVGVGALGFGVGRFNPMKRTFRFPSGRSTVQPEGT